MAPYQPGTMPWQGAVALGLGIIIVAGVIAAKTFDVTHNGLRAMAAITEVHRHLDSSGGARSTSKMRYFAILSFTDSQHRTVQFEDDVGMPEPDDYKVGQQLPVYYLPDETPVFAMVDRGWYLWLWPGVVALAGLCLIGFGWLKFKYDRPRVTS